VVWILQELLLLLQPVDKLGPAMPRESCANATLLYTRQYLRARSAADLTYTQAETLFHIALIRFWLAGQLRAARNTLHFTSNAFARTAIQ